MQRVKAKINYPSETLVSPRFTDYIAVVALCDAVPLNLLRSFSMSKRKAKTTESFTFNMEGTQSEAALAQGDDALLASMLGELDDEIVEEAHEPDLEAAVAELKSEAAQAVYADQDSTTVVDEADKPATDPEAIEAEATAPKKAKKAKAPKEPKAPRVTSITHQPGDRLLALLGGDKAWLGFIRTDDTIAAEKRAEQFIADMNARDVIADKVREKAVMLITWIASGKDTSALNEVLLRTFQVLFKDGELTSGKAGNLQTNLLSKPYSPGTAASQANQMFMLLPILGVTVREKGKMIANPESAIVDVMKLKLGM
jgi:hypothetical protein